MIAAKYGITESDLKSLNPGAVKGHSVFAGTRLKVYKYDDNKGSAKSSSNKIAKLPNYYKIQKGETMATISRKFGISVEQLKKRNKGIAEGKLQVGQKLRLQ